MDNINNASYELDINERKIEIFGDPGHVLKQYCEDYNKDEGHKHKISKN